MSLDQKYTWANFLKENPDFKKKQVKRTSAEATKAFETAFRKHVKEYLKNRLVRLEAEKKKAESRRSTLTKKQQAFTKAKKWPRAKKVQQMIGKQDATLTRLGKQEKRTKELQKNF